MYIHIMHINHILSYNTCITISYHNICNIACVLQVVMGGGSRYFLPREKGGKRSEKDDLIEVT